MGSTWMISHPAVEVLCGEGVTEVPLGVIIEQLGDTDWTPESYGWKIFRAAGGETGYWKPEYGEDEAFHVWIPSTKFMVTYEVGVGWATCNCTPRGPVAGPDSGSTEGQLARLSDGGRMEMSQFEGGGVRSSDEGKPDFFLLLVSDLSYDEQILTRAAVRMAEGAKTYARRNHELFKDEEALERAKASLLRHTHQYLNGETDEDHAAAILCNLVILSGVEKRVDGTSPIDGAKEVRDATNEALNNRD